MPNFDKIRKRWKGSSERSRLAAKNIAASMVLKAASILTSLMVVPLTISYVDSTRYGIWLTISSIVSWATFFDLGLANGFKNKFAQAKAQDDIKLARQYVSTTYALIGSIMLVLVCVIFCINNFIDWPSVLNVNQSYKEELTKIFMILSFFFCMNMIANIFVKLLEADQRPAIASVIHCIGQVLSLVVIFVLTKTTRGSLLNLAVFFAGIPFLTMAVSSVVMFAFTRYRCYAPSLKLVRSALMPGLLGMGFKFFVIYLCLIAVFQLMNIVISRECGAIAVTQYNIAYKYFSVVYMVCVIIAGPMWAAFTDAYSKKDYAWMKSALSKMELVILLSACICIVMLACSGFAYRIWIGKSVSISLYLSFVVMLYILAQVAGGIYMHMINGIGTIRLQFYIYLVFALISFPLMTWCCRQFGVVGIVVSPGLAYLVQAISGRIQLNKLISGKATGIWAK